MDFSLENFPRNRFHRKMFQLRKRKSNLIIRVKIGTNKNTKTKKPNRPPVNTTLRVSSDAGNVL
jgi:hypothetical protein